MKETRMRTAQSRDINNLANLYEKNRVSIEMFITKHLNRDYIQILIEDKEKNIISTCGVQIIDVTEDTKYAILCNGVTVENERNKGYMTSIVKELLKCCDKYKVDVIQLSTVNDAIIHICEKQGFNITCITMEKHAKK